MTLNKSHAFWTSVCPVLNDVVYEVTGTGLAHTGCSVDTSFFLSDPDPATDLLCGLEQFHLTSLLPPKDERIVLSAPKVLPAKTS